MSHIHLPDGVLPVWLWVSGYVLAILISVILFRFEKKRPWAKRLPLLGMMSAVMVLGAQVEIIPPVYHINLTVISGMLLGPSLIFLATFVVNVILALFGHGGITVIGLNTLVLSIEGVLGYFFLHVFWKVLKRLTLASFLATFLALFISASAMIGVVSLGTSHYEELIHHEKGEGMLRLPWGAEKENPPAEGALHPEINLKWFIAAILLPGFLGWILEGVITALMVKYIDRLRPDLLGLGIKSP